MMKTRIILMSILVILAIRLFSQPIPQKAPVDPNFSITAEELELMKANGVILPPIKPDFDPWKNFRTDNSRLFDPVYDMRTTGWLTSVKTQSNGACWAYSTMGAVEARLKMLGYGAYDLSDNNLKWCHKYVPERSTYGNHWMSSAYFARRSGPYLEAEDPFPGYNNGAGDCPTQFSAHFYINQSRYPPFDKNYIKQMVLDYGPVWTLMYYSATYFNTSNNTYFYGGTAQVNHAGCVVGWDDNKVTAGGTGAWIVKNTYGTTWGEQGYYYVSYNDSRFLRYNGFWPEVMENEANTMIHQYDEIGGYWGVGFNSEVGYGLVKFQNTNQNQEITTIGTFLLSTGCGVEIKIYDSFNGTLSGLLGSKAETISGLPGYYTFDLDTPIQIQAGEDFYVQVKYDSNDPSDFWPIAIEDTIAGYASPDIETGKFWIAPDPELWPTYWYQVGKNTPYHYDLCIKAYTKILPIPPNPIANAGSDATIADNESFYISGASAQNYSAISWTGGDGNFNDASVLNPFYFPGQADIVAGSVQLCITAQPIAPNTTSTNDCMQLSIIHRPQIQIISPVNSENFCQNSILVSGTATDSDNNLESVELSLNGGVWQTADGTENWNITLVLEQGINTIHTRAKDADGLYSEVAQIQLSHFTQIIPLPQGWSAISSYLIPSNANVENIMQDVVSNMVIMLGKYGIYAPAPYNFNTLINWDTQKGYKIKMQNADELIFCGEATSANAVNFEAGFQIIPVLTNVAVPILDIFENPENDILYIFDLTEGKIYWPEGGLFTLNFLEPAKGYMAYFKNPVTLNFPAYNETLPIIKSLPKITETSPWLLKPSFNIHFISIDKDAVSATGVDFIGAFDNENHCIGICRIDETGENYLLTVYGDDEFTAIKDGASEGESIRFKVHNRLSMIDESLAATFDSSMPQNDGTFAVGGRSKIVGFYKESPGIDETVTSAMVQIFPQPAEENISIDYPFTGQNIEFQLISMDGKVYKTGIIRGKRTELQIGKCAPGVYFLKIQTKENLILKKVVII